MTKKKDGRANNGGARKGAGAPKKETSQQAKEIMKEALRMLYRKSDDKEAQIEFLKEFAQTSKGQLFIAEHLFGKATDKTDITSNGEPIDTPTIKFIGLHNGAK